LCVVLIPEGTTMVWDNKESWMQLCELAAQEKDPVKLMALIAEIERLLETKQQRVTRAPAENPAKNPR
jgi:hypothetical protein